MNNQHLKHIAIFGTGLAGIMCAAALANILPDEIKLSFVDVSGSDETDIFFGNVTSPTIYDFFLNNGITEPELLPNTNTTFSLGTRYFNWGKTKQSWMQSFHKPLPIFHGVEFHHYLTRLRSSAPNAAELDSYIMSVHAADKGVFAHPPEGKKTPLSTVDYGYHFSTEDWRKLLSDTIKTNRVNRLSGDVKTVKHANEQICEILLSGGEMVIADLYIDCLGPNSKLSPSKVQSERHLKAVTSFRSDNKLSHVCRQLVGTEYGWYSETAFQNGQQRLTIYDPACEELALKAHGEPDFPPLQATIGYLKQPWQGNCLALGHTAAILEPLTPAPIMGLQRDIERLTELIPHTKNMDVEAREYNRRFTEDYSHSSMFQRRFFADESQDNSPYWKAATAKPIDRKLANKITQFQSRGLCVQYDLEPFGKEGWTQLHFGMGHLPRRYDPLANKADEQQMIKTFEQIRAANEALAKKMPPHHIYMKKLLEYFRKKHGG